MFAEVKVKRLILIFGLVAVLLFLTYSVYAPMEDWTGSGSGITGRQPAVTPSATQPYYDWEKGGVYVVQMGDDILRIGLQFGVDPAEVLKINPGIKGDPVPVNYVLEIPGHPK